MHERRLPSESEALTPGDGDVQTTTVSKITRALHYGETRIERLTQETEKNRVLLHLEQTITVPGEGSLNGFLLFTDGLPGIF